MEMYKANDNRYADMAYSVVAERIAIAGHLLGLWHNFGSVDVFSNLFRLRMPLRQWDYTF